MDGLLELAAMEGTQILVTAIVGMIGIRPTIEGIKAGKDIALANKETLVTAGHIIMPLAEQYGVRILPVDSEHSAIFQALNGEEHKTIDKLLITASGGPFRGRKTEDLRDIQVEDSLKHPNWAMGQKITIDSATLVNKGLEVMEAKWLFGVDLDQIQVVVQPHVVGIDGFVVALAVFGVLFFAEPGSAGCLGGDGIGSAVHIVQPGHGFQEADSGVHRLSGPDHPARDGPSGGDFDLKNGGVKK